MYILKQKIRFLYLSYKIKRNNRVKHFVHFDSLRKAIVFFDYCHGDEISVLSFVSFLEQRGIECVVVAYVRGIEQTSANSFVRYVYDDEIGMNGVSNSKDTKSILDEEYDVLFDLRIENSLVSDYISKTINAKYSVGNSFKLKGTDMVIETNGNIDNFGDVSLEYLKKLKES